MFLEEGRWAIFNRFIMADTGNANDKKLCSLFHYLHGFKIEPEKIVLMTGMATVNNTSY